MNNERKDEIQELYNKSDNIEKLINIVFWINVFLSIILLIDFKFRNLTVFINIILSILYVVLDNINELYFKNEAENERRKSLIKESFGINTTLKETNKYYNNNEEYSIRKLGINCYESVFFTQKVVNKMIFMEVIKLIAIAILYFFILIQIKNYDIILLATQTLFSSEILFKSIKLFFYKTQLNKICKKFEELCFIFKLNNENTEVLLLDSAIDYECLKSYCRISISSKIFFKYNSEWSKEWKKIEKKIKR